MGRKEINIRRAGEGEAPVLAGIIRRAFAGVAQRFGLTPENCPKHPSNCTDEWIVNDRQRGTVYYLLEIDGASVGCVGLETVREGMCYLERLAVLPAFRRRGLGRGLVEHVFDRAGEMDAGCIGIGIIAAQDELKSWYRDLGFIEKDTRHFDHLPFDVTFMEYALNR